MKNEKFTDANHFQQNDQDTNIMSHDWALMENIWQLGYEQRKTRYLKVFFKEYNIDFKINFQGPFY